MSQTKKALREALDEIALRFVSGNKIQIDSARISRSEWLLLQAALSLPETQGEPEDTPMAKLNNALFCEQWDRLTAILGIEKGSIIDTVDEVERRLIAALPSQPAQGEAATEKLRKLDAIIQETRDYLDMVEMLSEEPDLDRSDTLRLLGVLNDYRAMLAAAPAAPTQAKPTNGEGA